MSDLGQAYVQIIPKATGITKKIGNLLEPGSREAGERSGSTIASGIKKALVAAGIGAAVAGTIKSAVSEGSKLQQSYGGLDTIYGSAAEAAKKYAKEASQAGISANDYAEQAVSFGASLKQAFSGDTTKAVEAANTAIMDMTDNAAKMGTPIENIQNAYQGFAKQNYTMLDNLKLGYGGTKQEMERLLADAEKISGVHYDISNLGDVYDAIHVVQGELGLTGVAAKEASETFEGSFNAMKANWKNLLGAMTTGGDISGPLDNLMKSVMTFITGNLIPMVVNVVKTLPQLIASIIGEGIPGLISTLSNAIPQVVTAITNGLPLISDAVSKLFIMLIDFVKENGPSLIQGLAGLIVQIIQWLATQIPVFVGMLGQLLSTILQAIVQSIPSLIDALVQVVMALVEYNKTLWPTIMEAGVQLFTALVGALPQIIEQILAVLPQIIDAIAGMIPELLPTIIDAGIMLFTALVEALPQIIDTIVKALPKIITAIIDAIIKNIPAIVVAGVKLFVALVKNLPKIIVEIVKAIPKIVIAIAKGFGKGAVHMADAGLNLIKGLWKGIKGAAGWLWDKVSGWLGDLWGGIKDFFGIASPSKEMAWIGQMIDRGLARGILSAQGEVTSATDSLSSGVMNAMSGVASGLQPSLAGDYNISANGGSDSFWGRADSVSDSIVSGMATIAAANSGDNRNIVIPIYLYPSGPKMGEETVKMYDIYKRQLG